MFIKYLIVLWLRSWLVFRCQVNNSENHVAFVTPKYLIATTFRHIVHADENICALEISCYDVIEFDITAFYLNRRSMEEINQSINDWTAFVTSFWKLVLTSISEYQFELILELYLSDDVRTLFLKSFNYIDISSRHQHVYIRNKTGRGNRLVVKRSELIVTSYHIRENLLGESIGRMCFLGAQSGSVLKL